MDEETKEEEEISPVQIDTTVTTEEIEEIK
jgi:hypothetical protein